MKWRFRRVDWVTGISAIAVLGLGAAVLVGAPMIPDPVSSPAPAESTTQTAPSTSPDGSAEPSESSSETAPSQQDPKGPSKPRDRGGKKTDPGSGLELVLPGLPPTDPVQSVEFVVSSFNVLGSSHTRRGGNRPGMAAGTKRARWAAGVIRSRNVGIVGLQELEADQARVMMRALPNYGMYPGPSGRRHSSSNSIMWRRDKWQLVAANEIPIPYFGRAKPMPYIRLRNVVTDSYVWVGNFHNPVSSKRRGSNAGKRREATRRQVMLANSLRRRTGDPVIFTGDFNERAAYFCRLVGGTALEASNGGGVRRGRCAPPPNMGIDWIFGSPEIEWLSHYRGTNGFLRRITDHPIVIAVGRLGGEDGSYDAGDEATDALGRVDQSR